MLAHCYLTIKRKKHITPSTLKRRKASSTAIRHRNNLIYVLSRPPASFSIEQLAITFTLSQPTILNAITDTARLYDTSPTIRQQIDTLTHTLSS